MSSCVEGQETESEDLSNISELMISQSKSKHVLGVCLILIKFIGQTTIKVVFHRLKSPGSDMFHTADRVKTEAGGMVS